MFRSKFVLPVVMASIGFASIASGSQMLLDGLPGTTTYGDLALQRNDDSSSNQLNLPFAINFYGNTYSNFFVNNNGNISFNSQIGTFTPNPFPVANQPMIAAWWADVDTRGGNVDGEGVGNNVYVSAPNTETLVVTWNNVGYYPSQNEKLNNFQLVLRDRSADTHTAGDFDIEFRYNQLQWTTGGASGGSGGLGGTPAQAGFDAGDNTNFYALPGSRTADVLDLVNTSNVSEGTPGLWSFAIRNGNTPGTTSDNPLMPVVVDDSFTFDFNINLEQQQVFIDPVVAVGYDYQVTSGPNFASVLLPLLGDNVYELWTWDGTQWVYSADITADGSNPYIFASALDRFRILGIEESLGLDPTDPTAFVTGLTFDGTGRVSMNMTAVAVDTDGGPDPVPEPATALLMGFGLSGICYLGRRRKDA